MSVDDDRSDRQRYLAIYLQDHRAGAEAGVTLAGRCREHAPYEAAAELSTLLADVDEDRRTLAAIMNDLGVDPSSMKQCAGRRRGTVGSPEVEWSPVPASPLSVVAELEGMIGAVSVKRQLWSFLSGVLPPGRQNAVPRDTLLERADDQRDRMIRLHARIAEQLFGVTAHRRARPRPADRGDVASDEPSRPHTRCCSACASARAR
jgi:hypothetical protein